MIIGNTINFPTYCPPGSGSSFDNVFNTNAQNQQVWLIVGDSKARGTSPTTNDFGPTPFYTNTVFQYTAGSVSAVTTDVANAASGSPWPKFGIDYYRATGRKIVFVPQGSGGSNFYPDGDTNNWYTTGSLYTPARTAALAACTAIGTTRPRGILMILGANDERAITSSLETPANAEIGVNSLFSRLRSDFPNTPIYVWLLGRTENGTGGNVTLIRNYVSAAVSATSQSYIVVDEAQYLTNFAADNLHYSGFGNKFFGALAVKNMVASNLVSNSPISYSYNSASQTVFANFTSGNSLTTTEKNQINDFVGYLDSLSLWATTDAFQLYMLSSQTKSMIDLKRGVSKAAIPTGITWSQQQGVTTSGILSSFVDTNYTPSLDSVNYTLNSAMMGVFLRIATTASGVSANIAGCQNTAGTSQTVLFQSASGILHRNNSGVAGTYSITGGADDNSYYHSLRTTSTASTGNANGAGATAAAATSVSLPDKSFTLGIRNGATPDFPFAGSFGLFLAGAPTSNWIVYNKCQELIIDRILNP